MLRVHDELGLRAVAAQIFKVPPLLFLRAEKQLLIVPGATHLFEEPGALEEVARLARDWFLRYLTPAPG